MRKRKRDIIMTPFLTSNFCNTNGKGASSLGRYRNKTCFVQLQLLKVTN